MEKAFPCHVSCWSKQALVRIIGVLFAFLWRLIARTVHNFKCCCFSRCACRCNRCGNAPDKEIQIVGPCKECGTTFSFNETAEETQNEVTQLRKEVKNLKPTITGLDSENARLKKRCAWRRNQCGNAPDKEIQIVGPCKECGTTFSFNETAEKTQNELTQLRKEIKNLKPTITGLDSENARLKKSSDEITKQIMETKGQLENTSDDFSNTKLSRRFRQDLLENKYMSLLDWLTQDRDKEEQQMIGQLSKLLQKCYNICVRLADDQIKSILLLQKNDVSPTEQENADVFRNRRQIGQTEGQRKRIKEVVLKELFMSESMYGRTGKETQRKLKDFFEEYADSCWLMTISNPPLALKFNVAGSYYTREIKKMFKKYATQELVRDNSRSKGTVLHVVWPAVLLADGSGIFAKGEVVVVDENSPIKTDIF